MAGIQEQTPIILLLVDNKIPIQAIVMNDGFAIKPQNLSLNRFSRGSIFNTADTAFLNDFGEGVPTLNISGNTGFGGEFQKGFLAFKNMELMYSSYLRLRQDKAADPNRILLLYFDTINGEAFSCYPMRFTLTRSSQNNPHLYYYNLQLIVLADYLEDNIFAVEDIIKKGLASSSAAATILSGLAGLVSLFSGITII